MIRQTYILSLLLGLLIFSSSSFSLGQEKPHVVVVVGTHHYSAHLTLPPFSKELERLGFRTSLVMGEGDPEKKTENVLPGIEALDDADVAIFYARFLNLPDKEWKQVESYIKSGKPMIGLRTANHAFKFPKEDPRFHWNDGFGRRVLGTPYVAHQSTETNISLIEKYKTHPILTGVNKTNWESAAKLYLTRLQPGCVPLVLGEGEGKPRLLEKSFGTIQVNESETDVVAWTWQNEWDAKVFATSLGHAEDFGEESFTRMLINGVCWATDHPLPNADEKITTWDIEMEVPSKYAPRRK
jgi:type 1 glutamine amidotransferase